MLVVLLILGIVVAAITQLLISGTRAGLELDRRLQAQQDARLALDSLRREIHCAKDLSGAIPGSSITITLGAYCASNPTSSEASVFWCTESLASSRNALWRYFGSAPAACGDSGGVKKADYLTSGNVFTAYPTPATCERRKLSVDLPVDVNTSAVGGLYRLQDDIVLRNTLRVDPGGGVCPF